MAKICVFCSSAEKPVQMYGETARQTGKLIAERGHELVYGGSRLGLMGEVSNEFLKYSDKITEILPRIWANLSISNGNTIITKDISRRMNAMESLSDAFIALPGGVGTLEEIATIVVSKQIGKHQKPLTLVNTNNFFYNYLTQLLKLAEQGFMPKDHLGLVHVSQNPQVAIEYIENYSPKNFSSKF